MNIDNKLPLEHSFEEMLAIYTKRLALLLLVIALNFVGLLLWILVVNSNIVPFLIVLVIATLLGLGIFLSIRDTEYELTNLVQSVLIILVATGFTWVLIQGNLTRTEKPTQESAMISPTGSGGSSTSTPTSISTPTMTVVSDTLIWLTPIAIPMPLSTFTLTPIPTGTPTPTSTSTPTMAAVSDTLIWPTPIATPMPTPTVTPRGTDVVEAKNSPTPTLAPPPRLLEPQEAAVVGFSHVDFTWEWIRDLESNENKSEFYLVEVLQCSLPFYYCPDEFPKEVVDSSFIRDGEFYRFNALEGIEEYYWRVTVVVGEFPILRKKWDIPEKGIEVFEPSDSFEQVSLSSEFRKVIVTGGKLPPPLPFEEPLPNWSNLGPADRIAYLYETGQYKIYYNIFETARVVKVVAVFKKIGLN